LNRNQVEVQKRAAARFRAKVIDYKKTFNSESGKRVLYEMMLDACIMKPLPKSEPERSECEGMRQIVLKILTIMKVDPEQMTKLIREADAHAAKSSNI
jgi:hypothetical protein